MPSLSASRRLLPLLLALALAVALFAPTLGGGFVWDDVWLLRNNANVQDLARLPHALTSAFWDVSDGRTPVHGWRYYRPFVTLVYALSWQAFGGAAWGFRAVCLAAHLGCVALAWAWLSRRFGREALAGRGALGVGLALALFACHASRGESVAWVSGCTDVWMTLWMLASHALWSRGATAAACVPCALAVFSKEGAVALPILLAADAALGADRDPRPLREKLRALAPLAATVLGCLLVRAALVSEPALAHLGEALPSAPARVVVSLGGYVARLAFAWPARVLFPMGSYGRLAGPWGLLGFVVVAALVALVVVAWRRPAWRPWLADTMWLVVPLAPVLNVMPMFESTFLAQRFLYLPVLGAAALLLRATLTAPEGTARHAALALAALFTAVNVAALPATAAFFRDEVALWERCRALDPGDSFVCRQLASTVTQADGPRALSLIARCQPTAVAQGRHADAQAMALTALSTRLNLLPDSAQGELRTLRAVFESLLAGRPTAFMLHGQRIVVRPRGPGWDTLRQDPASFQLPYAISLLRTGDLPGAERALRALSRRPPALSATHANLALVLGRQGRWDEARLHALRARSLSPGDPQLPRLVDALTLGARLEGIADPQERAFRRAQVMLDLHAPREAQTALALFPPEAPPPVVMLRARAAVADGRVDEAVALVEAARARDPAHALEWGRVLQQLRALPR